MRYAIVRALTMSIAIDSVFISFSLLHAIAEVDVANRQREECDGDDNPNNVSPMFPSPLKLHKYCHGGAIFCLSQVWLPGRAVLHNQRPRTSAIASRRCNPARSGPIRHIGVAVIDLPTKGNVLAGHVGVGCREIPSLIWISRIFGGGRGAGCGGRALHLGATKPKKRGECCLFLSPL